MVCSVTKQHLKMNFFLSCLCYCSAVKTDHLYFPIQPAHLSGNSDDLNNWLSHSLTKHHKFRTENGNVSIFFNNILILEFIFKKVFHLSPWIFFYIHYIIKKGHYTTSGVSWLLVISFSLILCLFSLISQKWPWKFANEAHGSNMLPDINSNNLPLCPLQIIS